MKGWGANIGRDLRVQKASLLEEIRAMDLRADISGISAEEWAHRYNLEESLMEIYSKEEEFWHQRGSIKWVLFGDANTAYFQAIANGRRRRAPSPFYGRAAIFFRIHQRFALWWTTFISRYLWAAPGAVSPWLTISGRMTS